MQGCTKEGPEMTDDNRDRIEIPEHESHRECIRKWIKALFICEIVRLVISITDFLPLLSVVTAIVVIVAMFQLAVVNDCYKKAGVFYCIATAGGFVSGLFQVGIFSLFILGFAICSLIAKYYELNAHSELTGPMDEKLSDRWDSLFGLELVSGILAVCIAVIPAFIAALAEADSKVISLITTGIISLVNIVIELLYVIYMKQTLDLFKQE